MSHGYSAENHDWDLTLRAAWSLAMIGQAARRLSTENVEEREFASYMGSMLLSFCAIESFSASVAFSMPLVQRFATFDFAKYARTPRFWDKLELLCDVIPYRIDRSEGLFQTVGEMQRWRNLVTHASPYRIEPTTIPNTTSAPSRLHRPFQSRDYVRQVTPDNAEKFYHSALEYVELIRGLTGIDPRAAVEFTVGRDDPRT